MNLESSKMIKNVESTYVFAKEALFYKKIPPQPT
jgi:hypothetical protein